MYYAMRASAPSLHRESTDSLIQHEVNTSYRRGHMRQRGSASRDLAVRTYIPTYLREYTGSINSSSTRDVENGVVYRKLKKDGA